MSQLDLLSIVVPAFAALAKDSIRDDSDLKEDAQSVYSHLILIGAALGQSGGEWASGLKDEILARLLAALSTRLPRQSFKLVPRYFFAPENPLQMLEDLAVSIKFNGLGGYDECTNIYGQTSDPEQHRRYLSIIGAGVKIFHRKETQDLDKRDKFLSRVKSASAHLLDIYLYGDKSESDAPSFTLLQHPSRGIRRLANTTHQLLERHWNCSCHDRAASPRGVKDARLSLIRHRQFATQLPGQPQMHDAAKFEVLLPVCTKDVMWKITTVEVNDYRSQVAIPNSPSQEVNSSRDICWWISQSTYSSVDFLVQRDKLWHMRPKDVGKHHHTALESLQQLLSDDFTRPGSHISTYGPQEQLMLCYVLANSMMYLYPGFWARPTWGSDSIYFPRRGTTWGAPSSGSEPDLAVPYLSVELESQGNCQQLPDPAQYHLHPAILALGIVFLEIHTGRRFQRSRSLIPCQRYNEDNHNANELFKSLQHKGSQRNGAKRLSRGLKDAIGHCLKLEPPQSCQTNSLYLLDEGPIRHYILSSIVQPLASELETAYGVSLKDLDDKLKQERNGNVLQSPIAEEESESSPTEISGPPEQPFGRHVTVEPQVCLYGSEVQPADPQKKEHAKEWFGWHDKAIAHITQLRKQQKAKRVDSTAVRIAILDSGISLSPEQKEIYDVNPKIQYQSWVQKDEKPTEWQDEAGHGTHLATLVRKIAPDAAVHVARVFKKKPTIKSSGKAISEAILHAVDGWNVDIIVMSFGFGEEVPEIYESIKHAASKDVIMFAAASNDGSLRPDGIAWPARDTKVICVHSGNRWGKPSNFTPSSDEGKRIMTLGECVESQWPPGLKAPDNRQLMSGTSCAAPIAAGMVALVLDCAKDFLDKDEWPKLRRMDSVHRMFKKMREKEDDYWFIRHWAWPFDVSKNADEGWIRREIRNLL